MAAFNDFQPGDRVGNYTLESRLGRGGLGEVWLARHSKFTHKPPVAIKFMLHVQPDLLKWFEREADILDKLRANPHIISAEDYGEQAGVPYLVMKYAGGGSLVERMRDRLSLEVIASYITQAADGLDYAHRFGIIHRDLKPANILFEADGNLLLADFGIAHDRDYELTITGMSIGTPGYMAPEQFTDAKHLTGAADIYSLGIITFKLLTGHLPFNGKTPGEFEMGHRFNPIPPLDHFIESVPASMQPVIEKVLAKTPSDRYPTAGAFVAAFRQASNAPQSFPPALPASPQILPGSPVPPVGGFVPPSPALYGSEPPTTPLPPRTGTPQAGTLPLNPGPLSPPPSPPPAAPVASTPGSRFRRYGGWLAAVTVVLVAGLAGLAVWLASTATPGSNPTGANPGSPAAVVPVVTRPGSPASPAASVPVTAVNAEWLTPTVAATVSGPNISPVGAASLKLKYTTPALPGHALNVNSLALSPDGKVLATGSNDTAVKLWDTATGQEIATLLGHTNGVNAVAFSPDGKLVASGGDTYDHTIRLWDVSPPSAAATKPATSLPGVQSAVYSLAFSPDGKLLAGAEYNTIRLWEVSGGANRLLSSIPVSEDGLIQVTFSPDGQLLASAGADKTVRLWEVAGNTLRNVATFTGHSDRVNAVAFSPDGKLLASGGNDKTIYLWDATRRPASLTPLATLTGHKDRVTALGFNPQGKLLASGSSWDEGVIKLWEVAPTGGREIATLAAHNAAITALTYDSTGKRLVSADGSNRIKWWETTASGASEKGTIEGNSAGLFTIAVSPDGKLLATGSGPASASIKLWEAASGKLLSNLPLTEQTQSLDFSPDGKLLATASEDKVIRLWEVSNPAAVRLLTSLEGHTAGVLAVAFSPDGKYLLSGGNDKTVRLWEVEKGQEVAVYNGHRDAVPAVAFSPVNNRLATGGAYDDGTVRLWEVAAGRFKELSNNKLHPNGVWALTFTRDGLVLASSSSDFIKLTEVATGREIGTLKGPNARYRGMAMYPNGRLLASLGEDNQIRLWSLGNRRELFTTTVAQSFGAWSIAFSPDGKLLYSAHLDGSVKAWEVSN